MQYVDASWGGSAYVGLLIPWDDDPYPMFLHSPLGGDRTPIVFGDEELEVAGIDYGTIRMRTPHLVRYFRLGAGGLTLRESSYTPPEEPVPSHERGWGVTTLGADGIHYGISILSDEVIQCAPPWQAFIYEANSGKLKACGYALINLIVINESDQTSDTLVLPSANAAETGQGCERVLDLRDLTSERTLASGNQDARA